MKKSYCKKRKNSLEKFSEALQDLVFAQSGAGFRIRPEVTIGVCVRNCEDYIEDAIRSILDQDFPHELMEVIFVDDAAQIALCQLFKSVFQQSISPPKFFILVGKG
jgi:cellulose synthase/poly-beta-1,6-N-acetylglucosamine synthase-like glycosyltransferase